MSVTEKFRNRRLRLRSGGESVGAGGRAIGGIRWMAGYDAVIAIPARDEAALLPGCLDALARQRGTSLARTAVLVFANNCKDATAAEASALRRSLPYALHVVAATLPTGLAHAGGARSAAMAAADELLSPGDGILLATDADARPEPGWLAANRAALAAGADAVAGAILPDAAEAALLPPALRRREIAEARYAALLDEIAALADPVPHDPWPRHDTHSGASIAVRQAVFHAAGGIPPVPLGEDRAFFRALDLMDARIRHAPTARVVVSCRLQGRAVGGMADTLCRRAEGGDEPLDARLEPVADAWRRARIKRAVRRGWRDGSLVVPDPELWAAGDRALLLAACRHQSFGLAWAFLEAAMPLLARHRVDAGSLLRETLKAQALLAGLRLREAVRVPAGAAARPFGRPGAVPAG